MLLPPLPVVSINGFMNGADTTRAGGAAWEAFKIEYMTNFETIVMFQALRFRRQMIPQATGLLLACHETLDELSMAMLEDIAQRKRLLEIWRKESRHEAEAVDRNSRGVMRRDAANVWKYCGAICEDGIRNLEEVERWAQKVASGVDNEQTPAMHA
jgi:hypothetical protein